MREDYVLTERLLSREQIAEKVKELGTQITRDYADKDTVFVGILKGCFVFMADLARAVNLKRLELDFMQVSSYSGMQSTDVLVIRKELSHHVTGRHVLIVEDIVDTGKTLNVLKKYIADQGAASVKICTMLDKPKGREVDLVPDYCGFTVPKEFVVGYGLDADDHFRELPDIWIAEEE